MSESEQIEHGDEHTVYAPGAFQGLPKEVPLTLGIGGPKIGTAGITEDGDGVYATVALTEAQTERLNALPDFAKTITLEPPGTRLMHALVPAAPDFLGTDEAPDLLREMALDSLQETATQAGYTVMPDTLQEVARQAYVFVDTGEVDDDGEPIRAAAPLWMQPEGTEPEHWQITFTARARPDESVIT